jgi:hypothetical protein
MGVNHEIKLTHSLVGAIVRDYVPGREVMSQPGAEIDDSATARRQRKTGDVLDPTKRPNKSKYALFVVYNAVQYSSGPSGTTDILSTIAF